MTPAEAIKKIKELFNLPIAAPVLPVAAALPAPAVPAPLPAPINYPLADGTTATISALAVGGTVQVNGVAALDGDITLSDGTTVSTIGGIITVVTPAGAQCADDITMTAAVATMSAQFAAHKADELKRVNDLFAAAKIESDRQNKILAEMFALVQLMAGEETAKPADKAPKAEKKWDDMTPLEQFRATK